jgi:hypothetical protein
LSRVVRDRLLGGLEEPGANTGGGEDLDLIDQVADACASADQAQIRGQYAKFRVPDALLS